MGLSDIQNERGRDQSRPINDGGRDASGLVSDGARIAFCDDIGICIMSSTGGGLGSIDHGKGWLSGLVS